MIVLLLGCWVYNKVPDLEAASGGQEAKRFRGSVAVAPVQFMSDLNGDGDDFRDGVYVGNIVMTGGYVVENTGDAGLQTIAKAYEFNSIDAYRSTVSDWADSTVAGVLDDRGLSWQRIDVSVPAPISRPARGSHPGDGTDNINIPRFTLEPTPLDGMVSGVDVVVVPTVVFYYSHNSGWFVGQEHGCGAGARLRMLWTVYDAASGAPLEWRDVDRRTIEPYVFQANSSQLEDMLIEVEQAVAADLAKELLQ